MINTWSALSRQLNVVSIVRCFLWYCFKFWNEQILSNRNGSEDEQKCGLNLNNTTKLSLTVIRRASSFSDFGGLFLKSLEVNRKLLLSCSQCNVLCNDQHMLVHGQIRGSCQIFIRLSGRAYRARGTVSYLFRKKCDWTLFSHSLRFHHWWNFCVCHTGPYFAIE